ncbi:hypothetical protein [Vitiosangium sp. GDMCC 1.1324]|uniref:hypothetical protein n=1 Tax=Vitiosangium sp. (strain GDMCC 1.1324) TaxID=2138576 RepID=UPI000D37D816|nr:hypothetical protein [Vitiosangium sp. GDMCC 1.1324]PTL82273.1 hypothetical protein DAT35_21020 [Vitiosangium sp. GDMCC 1.1324]
MNRAQLKWMALALVLGGCEAQVGSEPQDTGSLERQTLAVKQPGREQVSTRLTLRWERNGYLQVVDAVELPGFLKLEKNLGDRQYVYEVRSGNDVLAVQGLDVDFEQRSAGGHPGEPDEHGVTDVETFFVDIPGLGLDELRNASVRILEVQPKHGESAATREAVGRLQQQGRLVSVAEVNASQVGSVIQSQGRRVARKALSQPGDSQQSQ